MYDVAVVGAGPCGATAARICAERGLATVLLEEHGTPGYPVQCAGLLSTAAWRECSISSAPILNQVRGARILGSRDLELRIDTGETKAVVVDRMRLDQAMVEAAVRAGAELHLKTMVRGIEGTTLLTRGVRGREELGARLIIAADGVRSGIARLKNMKRSLHILVGLQAEILHPMDPALVEVHPHAAPDFFGWAIPIGEGRVRVGLCGEREVKEHFHRFRNQFPGPCLHLVSGALPIGPMPRTYGDRVLYVGDAAGLVKPTSGGGIYTGLRSAAHAAEVAVQCCEQGRFEDSVLSNYQRRWEKDFGGELRLGYRWFRLRQKLTPEDIDHLITIFQDPDLLDRILRYGDMDRPGILVRHLIRTPALLPVLRILFHANVPQINKQ
jgi:digeranylgeranylglycerophospholipid reductase